MWYSVRLLQQRRPDAPQEWLKKLPQTAKWLEESLYRSAQSFVEYNDTNTLKFRLQQLAMTIGQKTAAKKNAEEEKHKKMEIARRPAVPPQQNPPPIQPARTHRVPSVNNSNSVLQMPGIDNKITPNDTGLPQVGSNVQGQFSQDSSQNGSVPTPLPPAIPKSSNSSGKPNSDRQQVLRHQQQRLVFLRHAAKCTHENGKCPVTPHCAGMKRLWKHIAECKDQKCLVPHCVSSRYVLSHYHRCKDIRCPVCGPVREAIHRSHEKSKQLLQVSEIKFSIFKKFIPDLELC